MAISQTIGNGQPTAIFDWSVFILGLLALNMTKSRFARGILNSKLQFANVYGFDTYGQPYEEYCVT